MPTPAPRTRYPFGPALVHFTALEASAGASFVAALRQLATERARLAASVTAFPFGRLRTSGGPLEHEPLVAMRPVLARQVSAAVRRVELARTAFARARSRREAFSRHRARFESGVRSERERRESADIEECNARPKRRT